MGLIKMLRERATARSEGRDDRQAHGHEHADAAPHALFVPSWLDSLPDTGWPASVPPSRTEPMAPSLAPSIVSSPSAEQRLLDAVLQGVMEPAGSLMLTARFGPEAVMQFDFAQARVRADPAAWHALRLERRLPVGMEGLDAGASEPGPQASEREMDLTLWDLGIAAGAKPALPLRDSDASGWRRALMPVALSTLPRYTAVPAYLALARELTQAGASTPAELARRCRVRADELRCFVQAGLCLALLHWVPAGGPKP